MGFTFSQRSKSGFGFRTSNPLLVPFLLMFAVCWWMCVVIVWLYWQLLVWPVRWTVAGVRAATRTSRRART
ncbi:hypothetical protein [Enterococcus hirae]|uniref:hypothetical protein n=1 Tax=Enterococcus hirae TaxID=1354 RepID=UPI001371973E|nr:hypothetical protein [Enterococcus hirae]NAE18278.1 hypothetical protein [Enterococcus hirae]